ncbi:MAG: hypothetical protein VXZ03_05725 [Actinomycetota bacterium]|nr:hypothetical protein [Actinomycetota bacterium]
MLHGAIDEGADGGRMGTRASRPPVAGVVAVRSVLEHLEYQQGNNLGCGVVQELDVAALEVPEKISDATVVQELAEGGGIFVLLEASMGGRADALGVVLREP